MPTYTDGVVEIRPMTPDDVDAHVAGDDEEQIRWLSGGPSTRESSLAWIQRNMDYWSMGGPIFNFGVVEVATNKLIGMVEANTDAEKMEGVEDGEANISYVLYPPARGRGYATRAVNLVLTFLAEKPFFAAIIRADENNLRSTSVAKRCGFVPTGQVLSPEITGLTKMTVFRRILE